MPAEVVGFTFSSKTGGWSPNTGTETTAVADGSGDGSYIASTGGSETITYTLNTPSSNVQNASAINSVNFIIRGRYVGGLVHTLGILWNAGGANDTDTITLTSSFADHPSLQTLNPDAGAWTFADLDTPLSLTLTEVDSETFQISEITAEIDYDEGGGGGGSTLHAVPMTGLGLL